MVERCFEFKKWYDDKGLAYQFLDGKNNTSVLVRGTLKDITQFITNLSREYNPRNPYYNSSQINSKLTPVIETGGGLKRDVFCFGNDRIRTVTRLDDERYQDDGCDGPFLGRKEYLQIWHDEQYNTKDSREKMIDNIFSALENMI